MNVPMLSSPLPIQYELGGAVGRWVNAVTEQWLLVAPFANPAMLEMFADRDSRPYRNLLPWSGEFAGKYLTSAVQVWQVTGDDRLKELLDQFTSRFIKLQGRDGYLGPWPPDCHLTNFSPHHGVNGLLTWDTWGHYHVMIGLMLWAGASGDDSALVCACQIADLICAKYLGSKPVRLVDTGSTEMNLAPAHALAKLYRLTGTSSYLEMALQIVDQFSAQGPQGPLAGDYLNHALAGKALYEMPKPRWESLHSIMTLAELYWITGDECYRRAFEQIWWGIAEFDRHNNGGFSSGEQATGNPYDQGTIETCCTIAWIALSLEMLKLSGNSIVADEIELSTLNSVLGMHSPAGRWATFTTPSDGARFASAHAIVFQARSGSPELNCCSVNSPRGLGMISEWAVLNDAEGMVINYYGPCSIRTTLAQGIPLEIKQETDYPISGRILLRVSPAHPVEFALRLRIPYWSRNTRLSLNHENLDGLQPGSYYRIERTWSPGDCLDLELDMSPHFWRGEKQCQGLVSAYHGPVLLAYDHRFNRNLELSHNPSPIPDDPFKVGREYLPVPTIDAARLSLSTQEWTDWHAPMLLIETLDTHGRPVYLCDFASAGMTGSLYRTWLPMSHSPRRVRYTRLNPLRSQHLP